MNLNPTPLEVLILLVVSLSIYAWMRHGAAIRRWWFELWKKHRGKRRLKPKSPEVCPRCTIWSHILPGHEHRHARAWRKVRSKSGRRKRVDTRGYACWNPACEYYRVTDLAVHALVSAGRRGVRKDILFLKCQACGQRQTSRLDTPMWALKTPVERVEMVVTSLAEGLDLSAAGRIFRHHPTTIARWVERCGAHGARLHEQVLFRVIEAGHVQLDELVTRVKNKTDRVFVWTAIAAHSKLILGLHIGGRTLADACTLVHQVMLTLTPGCLPVFTSDGLNHYFYALTAHSGYWDKPPKAHKHHWFPDPALLYGQLIKAHSGYKLKFLSSIIRLGERTFFRARLLAQGLTGKVQTSAIERHNLTLRELVAPLSHRTWSMAHDILHLWSHTLWGITYYNFIRINMALEVQIRGPSKHRLSTPAMAAGLTRRPWSVSDFLLLPLPRRARLSLLRIA